MAFKIDQAALERVINEGLRKAQPEVIERARAVVEEQYCAAHGQFAEIVDVHGQLGVHQSAQLEVKMCCDALRKKVRAVMNDEATDDTSEDQS